MAGKLSLSGIEVSSLVAKADDAPISVDDQCACNLQVMSCTQTALLQAVPFCQYLTQECTCASAGAHKDLLQGAATCKQDAATYARLVLMLPVLGDFVMLQQKHHIPCIR